MSADDNCTSTPHVEFSGVCKSYDGRNWVVRDLDLSVHRGEFLTMLGPSGSGKTTCLMMLAGFETPASGTIHINGVPVGDLPPTSAASAWCFKTTHSFRT